MTGPARITIELEPPSRTRQRWVARTRIEDPSRDRIEPAVESRNAEPAGGDTPEASMTARAAPLAQPMEPLPSPEQREPAVVPAGYEPPEDCTCLDGFCEADHANE